MVFRTNRKSLKYAPKEFSNVNARAHGIHLDAIKTHNILDNTDQLLMPTRSDTYSFSATPCSFDLQTAVSCYFKLDKDPTHAGLRTGLYGCDLKRETLYTLLHFFIFVAQFLIMSFHSLTSVHYIYIYIYMSGRILIWCFSQPGFNPIFGFLACLATLKSSDRTKQVCL